MQEIEENSQGETIDKRLQLYKNLREQMLTSLKSDQEQEMKAKMDELHKKIENLERAQRLKEQR